MVTGRQTLAATLKAVHILVVDDCPVQRLLSCMRLSQWGIHPELARNGLEAVLLFEEETFDLVLMDLHMPVMDGLTATAGIRVIEHQHRRSIELSVNHDITKGQLEPSTRR